MNGNANVKFCRAELALVVADVRDQIEVMRNAGSHIPAVSAAWVYRIGVDHWEFHYAPFYWHGSADNAYQARAKGWEGWLKHVGAPGYSS